MFTGLTLDPGHVSGVQRNETDAPPWMSSDLELEPPRQIFMSAPFYTSFQEEMVEQDSWQEQDLWQTERRAGIRYGLSQQGELNEVRPNQWQSWMSGGQCTERHLVQDGEQQRVSDDDEMPDS